jgi:flagellar L-ring protein precursor FlgH
LNEEKLMRRFFCGLVLLSAATAWADRLPSDVPPPSPANAPQPTPAEAMQRSGGSLLRATAVSMPDPNQAKLSAVSYFAVPEPIPRTLKKHDLVTIIVREQSEYKSNGTTDLQRNADFDAKINDFLKISLKNFQISGVAPQTPPEINTSGQRDFKGTADVDRSDSMTLRVTAEVIDVKPNGTLVLQARTHIKNDEEDQTEILSGICRVEDVTPDNTVISTQMYDTNLTKVTTGAVQDTTRRGWLPKLLDAFSPF